MLFVYLHLQLAKGCGLVNNLDIQIAISIMTVLTILEIDILHQILTYFKIFRKKKKKMRYCKRYLAPRKKGFVTKIGTKTNRTHIYMCFTSTQSKQKIERNMLIFDTDQFAIGIDNHTSKCLSPSAKDFIGPIKPINGALKGINSTLAVKGSGTLKWKIADDSGHIHEMIIQNAIYVPDMTMRLLSPQHWAQSSNVDSNTATCITTQKDCKLQWNKKYVRSIPLNANTNVPVLYSAPGINKYTSFAAYFEQVDSSLNPENLCCIAVPDEDHRIDDFLHGLQGDVRRLDDYDNQTSATNDQAELVRWHYRLGHLPYPRMRILMQLGHLPKKLLKVQPPKCAGCLYGAMTKRAWTHVPRSKRKAIKKATEPGQIVSIDQLESNTPGFIAHLKGHLTRKRYRVATIFVDHHSRMSYVHLQRSTSSEETVEAKRAFESFCATKHVRVLHYHADNGRFQDKVFMSHLHEKGQTISFCGVNAHFQNGIAEKRIRDLQEKARKMLLHAIERWPSEITVHLWPYSLRTANDQMNHTPDNVDGSSKMERFTKVQVSTHLKVFHTWGCPIYALNNTLQAGSSIPKWNPRARIGINLGLSPRHARSVSLVLNVRTGNASPQFHVIHDDFFETITKETTKPSKWQSEAGFIDEQGETIPTSRMPNFEDSFQQRAQTSEPTINEEIEIGNQIVNEEKEQEDNVPELRRSSRVRRMTTRMSESIQQQGREVSFAAVDRTIEAMHEADYSIQDSMVDPISFAGITEKDTMYFHEAMAAADREEFIKAVVKEINDHIDGKHWIIINEEDVPEGANILDAVWSMKRKRDIITRKVYKWKARLNVHGGQQEYAINFYETYAPVVTWYAIRLLFTLLLLNNWYSRQIDFILAYPQADIEFDTYMRLPQGITSTTGKSKVLKLLKNIYGQKQAGRVFFLYLKEKLEKLKYVQSQIDECIFYKDNLIFFFYVDDGIMLCSDEEKINQEIKALSEECKIEDKGQIEDYLGVNVNYRQDKYIELTQPQLIDEILNDLGLDVKDTIRETPALSSKILHRHLEEPEAEISWNYRSVIGKLNYLEKSTRPDLAYSVHQCARFMESPKKSHAAAVEHIGRYLLGSREKGLVLKPKKKKCLENYVDADFCGNWNKMWASEDAITAKSRTGFIVMYAGCPITWCSKLQTMVALSTTEAEYIALSHSLREVIPMIQLLDELKLKGFETFSSEPIIHCKCFEDNSGALEISRLPKIRPRTKHINVVYHHFRSFVKAGKVKILPIDTLDQIGDAYTKPLAKALFVKFRKLSMGW